MDMPDTPFDPLHRTVIAPAVFGLTALLWGESLLEVLTLGGVHSSDNLTGVYLSVLASYATGIEVQKWMQAQPADPAADPWLEKVQRGGGFVGLWLFLLIGTYLARLKYPDVPMPASLKPIVTGIIPIFLAKRASRHVRHTRRGVGGGEDEIGPAEDAGEGPVKERLLDILKGAPEGLGFQELVQAMDPASSRQVSRALKDLLEDKAILRAGRPRTPDVRYRAR